jgi:RecJ-like exonuclease
MICPRCHGKHVVTVNAKVVPCPECGGLGELHCCDGLQEQVGEFQEERQLTTETQRTQRKAESREPT